MSYFTNYFTNPDFEDQWTVTVPDRARVYRFGTLWFWKCDVPGCAGGRFRDQGEAMNAANAHLKDVHR